MKKSFHAGMYGLVLLGSALSLAAQQTSSPVPQSPGARTPAPAATPTFPVVDPKNFTAASPSAEEVNSFLKALWGYDENRIWSVAAIFATAAPGVSKVVVFVADKNQPGKASQTVFFTTPDGKHAIAENVIQFGAKPFAEVRTTLQAQAVGPARGAASKDLMLVEFADLQCPRCREVQSTMDALVQDFPKARIVFQQLPMAARPFSFRAAAVGECLRKAKGDAAFFPYAQAVLDGQEALSKERAESVLGTAVAKAGGDSAATLACADTQPAKDAISASAKLAADIGVSDTPTLVVNGHILPLIGMPYDVLKRIIVYQANQDGVPLVLQPSLRTLK